MCERQIFPAKYSTEDIMAHSFITATLQEMIWLEKLLIIYLRTRLVEQNFIWRSIIVKKWSKKSEISPFLSIKLKYDQQEPFTALKYLFSSLTSFSETKWLWFYGSITVSMPKLVRKAEHSHIDGIKNGQQRVIWHQGGLIWGAWHAWGSFLTFWTPLDTTLTLYSHHTALHC